jgi:hypothetical protein
MLLRVDPAAVTNGADAVALVKATLDPVLAAYGFAPGQGSWGEPPMPLTAENPAPVDGMVIYCRPIHDGSPGCEDVVVYLRAVPTWHVPSVLDDDPRSFWTVDYDDGTPMAERLVEVAAAVRARVLPPGSGVGSAAGPT